MWCSGLPHDFLLNLCRDPPLLGGIFHRTVPGDPPWLAVSLSSGCAEYINGDLTRREATLTQPLAALPVPRFHPRSNLLESGCDRGSRGFGVRGHADHLQSLHYSNSCVSWTKFQHQAWSSAQNRTYRLLTFFPVRVGGSSLVNSSVPSRRLRPTSQPS